MLSPQYVYLVGREKVKGVIFTSNGVMIIMGHGMMIVCDVVMIVM